MKPHAAAASRASADRIDPARLTVDAVAWRVTGGADIGTEAGDHRRTIRTFGRRFVASSHVLSQAAPTLEHH